LKHFLTLEDQGIKFFETWTKLTLCHIPADMNPEQNDIFPIAIKFNTLYTICTTKG
jgi:hypothetical protein